METYSNSQIDRLGERLKTGRYGPEDLKLLQEHRDSFKESYDQLYAQLEEWGFSPSGRRAKSTPAIVDKLCRESIRLSQMQDIAGCRLVVNGRTSQDMVVDRVIAFFEGRGSIAVIDRRSTPNNGYRAVHLIANAGEKPVEIQIRTWLEQIWAAYSESLSDRDYPNIKYGAFPAETALLEQISKIFFEADLRLAGRVQAQVGLPKPDRSWNERFAEVNSVEADQRATFESAFELKTIDLKSELAAIEAVHAKMFMR